MALYPERLNLISLCTGGGGLDLGLELACPAARAVIMVEREAFACAGLVAAMREGLLAEAAVWSDVGSFHARGFRGLVDGVIGGIPCQPHSLAGKRLGEDDERDLWSDARRIIVQSGAWFVVIENVEGMLTSGGAERVVGDLQRLGFAVEIGLFSASETGASHQRNRVFILAVADGRHGQFSFAGWGPQGPDGALLADDNNRPGGKGPRPRAAGYGQPELGSSDLLVSVANPGRSSQQRWRGTGDLFRATGEGESEGHQRQRDGRAARHGGKELADAVGERGSPWIPTPSGGHGIGAEPAIALDDRDALVDASIERCGEGQPEPELRSGRDSVAGAGSTMDDATRLGDRPVSVQQGQPRRSGADVAGAGPGNAFDVLGLFPPGPPDLDGWRRTLAYSPQLEPAVRRMADGVAARLDLAGPHAARIERLRLLGNGVVPLQAAYAFKTLCARLAARGSAGAARLVRLMVTA